MAATVKKPANTATESAWVVPTNEELMIARHTGGLLGISGRRQ